ncbi:MAG: BREX-2 system phosphatase PglZ, partial [Actinomycetota bacterium]|nr:BREX-2 system phosphatase PglZ [Actinomycetota bacterium]
VAPLAVGLAVEALANGDVSTGQQRGQAAGLLFARHLGGEPLSTAEAREVGRATRVAIGRRMVTDPDGARNLLAQAQALLGDLGWAEGAAASDLLPAGLLTRLRALGVSLEKGAEGAETALRHLLDHMLARPDDATVLTARMAVRLTRWLTTEESPADTIASTLRRHLDDGAWVDRALGLVWSGSEDPELSARYAALVAAVRARRTERDRTAAVQLAAHTSSPHPVEGAVAIEHLLSQVVKPWSVGDGVLLVVLDGMSASVATEVAEAAQELGLVEWVPDGGRRMCALAALPSLTEISRATLLSGALTTGTGPVEKRGLAAAFPGASLFHKDDLRASAGAQLPPAVMAAIAATGTQPVVAVVINTIDDTLHKQDPSSTRWTLDRLTPLKSLLSEARTAGRTVILTSDHGHVVERATEARSVPGASARWRDVATGPAGEGEVLVSGRRVLTSSHEAVLLWREDVHYGPRQTGYHGGASLAEVTVPVIVLRRGFELAASKALGASSWKPASPQSPEWWNEPARAVVTKAPAVTKRRKTAPPAPSGPDTPMFEFEETRTKISSGGDLADAVLASAAYAAQRTRAGRRSADDTTVAAVLRALLSRGNRCHRDTLATAVGVSAGALEPTLAAVKRLLNVDGYPVIEQDADQVTVKLDETLLREQFELGGS